MKAICGFFRLDGAAADSRQLAVMRAGLVYNPAQNPATFDGRNAGPVGLGTAEWARTPTQSIEPSLHYDAESGCIAVADARLNERDILAKRLGLSTRDGPGATQAGLILQAYLRWGDQCAAELYGDFAIAVWDPRHQRLFCARDIMGVRPLYVHCGPDRLFAFASRAEALLCLPGIPKDLDEGRIADVLVQHLEGIDKTCTFFSAVQRLPPAHFISTSPDRSQRQRYWRLQPGLIEHVPATDAQWAEILTEVLEQAVRHHLVGDERVGCTLSGGLDSSSLAVIAKDQLGAAGRAPLPTFSSVDSDPACLETRAIGAMLELPGFAPTVIDPDAIEAMREDLAAALWQSEEPFDSSMLLIHAQYLAAARDGVCAVMDGIDGDILFSESGGLVRYLRTGRWRDAWRNARGDQRIYPGLPAWKSLAVAARGVLVPDWLRRTTRSPRLSSLTRGYIKTTLIAPDFALRVNLKERLQRHAGRPNGVPRDVADQALQDLDQAYTTCGLERYHRVGARHGIDPRHPFTDRKVLEVCVNLPDPQRMSEGWSKIVLRRAMQSRLPDSVCWRLGKQHLGWGLIENVMLKKTDEAEQRLAANRELLRPYVDLNKLDFALRFWRQADRYDARQSVFDALSLGDWLARRANSDA